MVLSDLQAIAKRSGGKQVLTSKEAAKALSETASVAAAPRATLDSTNTVKSDSGKAVAKKNPADVPASLTALTSTLPQITLDAYAPIAAARTQTVGARQSVAIVYVRNDSA